MAPLCKRQNTRVDYSIFPTPFMNVLTCEVFFLAPWHRLFFFLFYSYRRTAGLNHTSQSLSAHIQLPPFLSPLHMYAYQPPEIPVGWPQPDVWSLVLIKGPDSLLEPVLMERGEAELHTQDQMLRLPSAVMSWLGPHHWCLPFLNHCPKQWSDRDLRRKGGRPD